LYSSSLYLSSFSVSVFSFSSLKKQSSISFKASSLDSVYVLNIDDEMTQESDDEEEEEQREEKELKIKLYMFL